MGAEWSRPLIRAMAYRSIQTNWRLWNCALSQKLTSFCVRQKGFTPDISPSELACEERPWKSPSPRADFLKLAGVRVARGSGAFVYKISCQDMLHNVPEYWPPFCLCGYALDVF